MSSHRKLDGCSTGDHDGGREQGEDGEEGDGNERERKHCICEAST